MGYIGAGITRFNTADELTVTGDAQIDTTTLVVDSTNNRVGIGTDSPADRLHVFNGSSGRSSFASNTDLIIEDNGNAALQLASPNTNVNAIYFSDPESNTVGALQYSHITDAMSFDTVGTTRMTIDSSGNLLVGTTTASSEFTLAGRADITNAGLTQILDRTGSDGDIVRFEKDGSEVGAIGSSSGKTVITLDPRSAATTGSGFLGGDGVVFPSDKTGAASDADVSLGGASTRFKDLYLSGGAYLGGTAAANKLDDYEEGTWTPTGTTNSGTAATFSSVVGSYVKIGNLVTVNGEVRDVDTTGTTSTSQFRIAGLPFAPVSTNWTGVASVNNVALQGSRTALTGQVIHAGDAISFIAEGYSTGRTTIDHGDITSGTSDFFFSIQYQTFS